MLIIYSVDRDGTLSPWVDEWAAIVKHRFDVWFANFSAIGGTVDFILSDFESGGRVYWYEFVNLAPSSIALLVADPRWEAARASLNTIGARLNASFNNKLRDIASWTGFKIGGAGSGGGPSPDFDWRPWIWDEMFVDTLFTNALNSSVYAPIASLYPRVEFSNFANHYHTDASAMSAHEWWVWSGASSTSCAGIGSHVGSHQSTSLYGGRPWYGYSHILSSQRHDRVWSVTASPFNAFVQGVKEVRDMMTATATTTTKMTKKTTGEEDGTSTQQLSSAQRFNSVPLHPWFAPRDFHCSDPGHGTNATSHLYGSDFWQEQLFHVILSSGATSLYWWKPGAMLPSDVGVSLLVSALRELSLLFNDGDETTSGSTDGVETGAGGGGLGGCTELAPLMPIVNDATSSDALASWSVNFVVSGATCGDRTLHRFTPRCVANGTLATTWCVQPPLPWHVNGSAATFKIGSGFNWAPVEGGRIVVPENGGVAPHTGFWILS